LVDVMSRVSYDRNADWLDWVERMIERQVAVDWIGLDGRLDLIWFSWPM